MIIDLILDRLDGAMYSMKRFYDAVSLYERYMNNNFPISRALDMGTENDVRKALCKYIDEQGYNPKIKDFVNCNRWVCENYTDMLDFKLSDLWNNYICAETDEEAAQNFHAIGVYLGVHEN